MVRDVAPVHSESESERETRRASRKDQPASRDAMDVDVDEENGEEEGAEEFEIEKILDARMGMFPSVRQVLIFHVTGQLTGDLLNKGPYGLLREVEGLWR